MRIHDRIHLVGSGLMGMRLSHPYDCNVYLIDGGNDAAIIDSGSGLEPERIVHEIHGDGINISKVSTLLLTHTHGDHAAGARFWHDNLGLRVLCASEAKPWIEEADESKFSLDIAREAGMYPRDFKFPPCPVARGLCDGDKLQIGDVTLDVLETPGHARGHICFWWAQEKVIFAGDVVFPGGKIAPQMTWDFDIRAQAASIKRLHDLEVESLLSGHGAPLIHGAHRDIEMAHECCLRLKFPPSLNP